MKIRGIVQEDFDHYKKPSLVIAFPYCSFKCDKECGRQVCQNHHLLKEPIIEVSAFTVVAQYLANPITQAIVLSGLEPFDSFTDVADFIYVLRNMYARDDDVVIYTGYTEEELKEELAALLESIGWSAGRNIIIKYGRYIPGTEKHFDDLLGVNLYGENQYAKRLL